MLCGAAIKSAPRKFSRFCLKRIRIIPTYWVWLSASVDNTKERIYCLQTALKLDPENGTAKRGLILLGALAPDESVQPFPMNRPRAWEEKLLLAHEKPKERGFRAVMKSPVVRLMGVAVIGAGLIAVVLFGFVLPSRTSRSSHANKYTGAVANVYRHANQIRRSCRSHQICHWPHAFVDAASCHLYSHCHLCEYAASAAIH